MSDPLEDIRHSLTVAAPLTRVAEALNDPAQVATWLGCMQYSGEVGSVFYMQPDPDKRAAGSIDGATHCELLGVTDTSMEFTWYFPDTPKTTVAIRLTAVAVNETEIHLEHSGWDQFPAAAVEAIWAALRDGWKAGVLAQLKGLVEAG